MMSKQILLVDLNIVIDVLQKRDPFYEDSARILDLAIQGDVIGYLAAHSVTTLFYILRHVHNQATVQTIITQLLAVLKVASVTEETIKQALQLSWKDFEDAVQMSAAQSVEAHYLITRNPKDFETEPVKILEPHSFLAIFNQQ